VKSKLNFLSTILIVSLKANFNSSQDTKYLFGIIYNYICKLHKGEGTKYSSKIKNSE